ncbi:TRAP transporter large permease subunit [Mesorhizobium sp. M00.F.Ca.ET.216.01.1.1]|uniref:TRAP transporter large permease subunit n=1 Tax=Mesorhizobium sp. M00.F.Ca.ET.216.01.1.1 TaxID=2500528 RepID=UPI001FE00CC0|nr:TRAP transporter large permease subunit [Mesorhizobium sp. M00.F.Ca.ET.216.01.1.1]
MAPYGVLVLMTIILFVLGMFLDWVGILLLTVPIFLPILKSLEFGGTFGLAGVAPEDVPLWYGVIFMVNMQMAFLSPPFGYSLLRDLFHFAIHVRIGRAALDGGAVEAVEQDVAVYEVAAPVLARRTLTALYNEQPE